MIAANFFSWVDQTVGVFLLGILAGILVAAVLRLGK